MSYPVVRAFTVLLAAASFATAQAQDPGRIAFSAGPLLTTTGIGVSGHARFNERWSASLDLSFLPLPDVGTTYAGEEVTASSAVRSAVLLGHYHPSGGALALGAGVYLGGHRFDLDGTPSSEVEINGNTYSAASIGTFVGEFEIMDGPALLFEVGTRGEGYVTSFGLGIPSGSAVELTATGPVLESERAEQFREDTAAEVQNIRDFADAWPVVVYARFGYLFGL